MLLDRAGTDRDRLARIDRTTRAVEDAIEVEARALRKHQVEISHDAPGLASLLRGVYEKLTGDQAADPLTIVDDQVRAALGR